MQWNYTGPFLQNPVYDPFSFSKASSYPHIIGEGDVTSVIYPDGSVQLYFVPTNRHITWSTFQVNANSSNPYCSANPDIWFVRSISHPLPPSLLSRPFPNVYGDQLPPSQFNSNFCINSPPTPDYYQKFHNDDSTSTTDIIYFYPSLRSNGNSQYSAEVQTDPVAINNKNEVDACNARCVCKCPVPRDRKDRNAYSSASSTSYMSIDSASKSKHKLNKKKKKSKSKSNKSRDNRCEYHLKNKNASDKVVATYAEKASGGIIKNGRHTQTANKRNQRSDIKTEIWLPIDSKSSSRLKILSCNSSYSCKCCCRCTSETDGH